MIGIYKGLLAKEENYNVQILKCLNYIEQNDGLEQTENGKYAIEDEDIFVNITEYETKEKKETYWEAHKKYLDLHFIISGTEKVCIGSLFKMNYVDYDAERDLVQVEGDGYAEVVLERGDFLLLDSCDVHKTGIVCDGKTKVKKAIFKIRIVEK